MEGTAEDPKIDRGTMEMESTVTVQVEANPVSQFPVVKELGVKADEPSGIVSSGSSTVKNSEDERRPNDPTLRKELQARHNENRALAISCLVAVVLTVMAIALWYIWFTEASKASRNIAKKAMTQLSSGIQGAVVDFAGNSTIVANMVKDYYTRSEVDYFVQTTGSTDTADTQKAALYLTALLYTFPGITNVYVGSSTALGDRFVGAVTINGAIQTVVKDTQLTGTCLKKYPTGVTYQCTGKACIPTYTMDWNSGVDISCGTYVPSQQEWYQTGAASSTLTWFDKSYINTFSQELTTTQVFRLMDNTNSATLNGVIGVDLNSEKFNSMLKQFHSQAGNAFILDSQGYLMGASSLAAKLTTHVQAQEYTDDLIQRAAQDVLAAGNTWASFTSYESIKDLYEYWEDSISGFVITDSYGLRWLCFEVIEHRDIYHYLPETYIVGMTLTALMVVCLLGYIFIPLRYYIKRRVLRPEEISIDPNDEVKDLFFESHANRALKVQCAVMLCLAIIWMGWSVGVSDAVSRSVKSVVDASSQTSVDATENLVLKPYTIAALMQFGYFLGDRALNAELTNTATMNRGCRNSNIGATCTSQTPALSANCLDAQLVQMQKTFPEVDYVYIGFADTGHFIGCRYTSKTSTITEPVIGLSDQSTGYKQQEFRIDSATNTRTGTYVYQSSTEYDARSRGWYVKGKGVYDAMVSGATTYDPNNASWTDPYTYFTASGKGSVGVTAVRPFWDSTGLRGVFGVDLRLESISSGLKTAGIDTSGDGRSWILETEAVKMIGSSTDESISSTSIAYSFTDDTIKTQSQTIAQWYSFDWTESHGTKSERSDPVIRISSVGSEVGLSWTQVVTATYKYFYGESDDQIHLSYVFIMLVFAVVSFIIYGLVNEMRSRRDFDLRKRLFDAYDDPSISSYEIQQEINGIAEIRSRFEIKSDEEGDVRRRAAEIVHKTMKMIKTKMKNQFIRPAERTRRAIQYLAIAQDDMAAGKGGVTRLIMTDHFSPDSDEKYQLASMVEAGRSPKNKQKKTKTDDEIDSERKADKHAKKVTEKQDKKSRKTIGFKIYALIENPLWKFCMGPLIYFFIVMEYVDDSAIEFMIVEGILLAVLLFDAYFSFKFTWIERETLEMAQTTSKPFHLGVVILTMIFWILKCSGYPDPLRFTRPLLLVWRSPTILRACRLMRDSMINAGDVFLVYFMTILLGSIFALILFRNVFTDEPTMDNFMDTSKHMFVLMATGENYADIIPAALPISKWYFVFFLCITVVGIFFLTSLVIATFENQYESQSGEMRKLAREARLSQMAPAFCLWTYSMQYADLERLIEDDPDDFEDTLKNLVINKASFLDMMNGYWNHKYLKSTLHRLCKVHQKNQLLHAEVAKAKAGLKAGQKSVDRLEIELLVKDMPLSEPEPQDIEYMKNVMLNYSERVFKLLDTDDSLSIDFVEFEKICMFLKIMPELHFNEVFYKEMQKISLENLVQQAKDRLDKPPEPLSREERDSIKFNIDRIKEDKTRLEFEIEKAKYVALDNFWGMTEKGADAYLFVYTLVHITFLALYGTQVSDTFVDSVSVIFTGGHCVDILGRIITMHRSRRWYIFSDYPQVQFKRRSNVIFVGVGGLGFILFLLAESDSDWVDTNTKRFYQMLMACSALRVLVLSDEFSALLLSMLSGVQSLRIFVVLLCIIVYEFASFSYCAFKQNGWFGVNAPSHDEQGYWDSPIDSLITMYQLLVGEGWHEVMLWTESYTYKIVWFYFVIYTMIVVILFSQLFIGIMISMFQATEDKRQEGGDMYRLLGGLCPDNTSKEAMNDLIYGLMNTRVPLDDFSNEDFEDVLEQINKIQKAWRLKSNEKLFQKLQKETHPVCALYDNKFSRSDKNSVEISQYLMQIPVHGLLVKKEVFKTDSWIEQHELVAILYKRFNYFTQWTKVRLQNGQSVFELSRFIALQL